MHKVLVAIAVMALSACTGTMSGTGGGTGGSGGGGSATGGGSAGGTGGGTAMTLCAKYGGASNVDMVVRNDIVSALAGDCRIQHHFTSLPSAGLTHVVDCLSTQVQELFSCPGVSYAGSKDSAGVVCRDMISAHAKLGLSAGDFNALIEDVVAGLQSAGVAQDDINAAAPALLAMKGQIVSSTRMNDLCQSLPQTSDGGVCANATDGGASCTTACDRVGGPKVVDTVVQTNLVGALAGDCRISKHFTDLSTPALTHVSQCLSTQVQEVFGCGGFVYAGSKDSSGQVCRSMHDAHAALKISDGDFNALIEDTVATLQGAGVPNDIIGAAGGVLTSPSLKADVITHDAGVCNTEPLNACAAADAGTCP